MSVALKDAASARPSARPSWRPIGQDARVNHMPRPAQLHRAAPRAARPAIARCPLASVSSNFSNSTSHSSTPSVILRSVWSISFCKRRCLLMVPGAPARKGAQSGRVMLAERLADRLRAVADWIGGARRRRAAAAAVGWLHLRPCGCPAAGSGTLVHWRRQQAQRACAAAPWCAPAPARPRVRRLQRLSTAD